MDTKLTLKLDQDVIEQAKSFAKEKNTSLSKLIENYLSMLVEQKAISDVTPLVKSLSGIVSLPENFDQRSAYQKHLVNKYQR
ncbi:MAG: hypothetical protein RL638_779 [Bacteroidota bacterium]|jgi:hypothetical protein